VHRPDTAIGVTGIAAPRITASGSRVTEPIADMARSKRVFAGLILQQERSMNWDRIEGNWKQFSGKVKEKWGDLTDDDLTKINGKRDQLEGLLQQRYGYAKDKAKEEVDRWSQGL
jgi:uncharacterized protein YjbJ (UPF0337 family)